MADYDLGEAFKSIEEELIASMIRNLDHHRAEETDEGIQWSQWQVEQLNALEEYRRENREKFNPRFRDINAQIPDLIDVARQQGGMDQEASILEAMKQGLRTRKTSDAVMGEFFTVNDRKLNALVNATQNDFSKAEHAVLRMANDKYRKAIFNAQVYANAGGTTYEKAVDMATRDMLRAGLNCVEYKNGARHTLSDYADMCLKTATKRAYLTGEGEKRKEWGIATVIMNKRGNPCPLCAPWCGKVLIDDVWSGGKPDGKHPLMSTAIEKGLYHPRCKDVHTTYFPGISTADDPYDRKERKELVEDYNQEQKQSYYERQTEQCERIGKYSLDSDNKRMYEERSKQWKKKIDSNGEIQDKRKNQYGQEREFKDDYNYLGKIEKVAKSVENGIIKNIELPPEVTEIEGMTPDIEKAIRDAFDKIANEYDVAVKKLDIKSLGAGYENVPFQYIGDDVGSFLRNRIVINKDYYFENSLDEYNKKIMGGYKDNILASQNIEDLIAHEMAHVMTFQDCDRYSVFERVEEEVREEFIAGMSGYADEKHDGAEVIAEAFVRYRRGETLPDDIMELLNKYVLRRKK